MGSFGFLGFLHEKSFDICGMPSLSYAEITHVMLALVLPSQISIRLNSPKFATAVWKIRYHRDNTYVHYNACMQPGHEHLILNVDTHTCS